MTTEPTCGTCRHFKRINHDGPIDLSNPDRPEGLCRRNPPQVSSLLMPQRAGVAMIDRAVWPTVKRADACGAHQPQVTA